MPSDPATTLMHQDGRDLRIDDHSPSDIVAPANAAEAAEILADAAARGLAVAPVGGGTSLALGNVPRRLDVALLTKRLRGIIDYEPADLTVSVAAGSRFADVLAVLAEHGQTLPIEVPRPARATIGGLIATAMAGPRRLGAGTMRDLLIGISAAHPSGTVTKAGGMVVKNVTGFDLMRLYHGSLGTLGVIVSANFKVLPLARSESTVLAAYREPADAIAASTRIRSSRVRPVALEVVADGDGWQVAARIEGREETVRLLVAEAREVLAADSRVLDGPDSAAWWRTYVERQALDDVDDAAVVRCAVRPKTTGELLHGVIRVLRENDARADVLAASPGLGTVTIRCSLARSEDPAPRFRAVQAALQAIADHTTVMAAPADWKRGIDVWGSPPATLDVMRAMKREFDPHGVLNPGRYAGGI